MTLSSGEAWTWLARRVDVETATRVRALDLPGVGLVPESRRVYTMGGAAGGTTLAAQVLGFVNVDGVGQYGVEGANDPFLAVPRIGGRPGGRGGRLIAGRSTLSARRWRDVTLTIDAGLQHLLEEMLDYTRNRAQGVTG